MYQDLIKVHLKMRKIVIKRGLSLVSALFLSVVLLTECTTLLPQKAKKKVADIKQATVSLLRGDTLHVKDSTGMLYLTRQDELVFRMSCKLSSPIIKEAKIVKALLQTIGDQYVSQEKEILKKFFNGEQVVIETKKFRGIAKINVDKLDLFCSLKVSESSIEGVSLLTFLVDSGLLL